MIIAWWSGGITSAVACRLALDEHGPEKIKLLYIETGSHHPDTERFKEDCEQWYNMKIETIRGEPRFVDHFTVLEMENSINWAVGASCTRNLKRYAREKYERKNPHEGQVWGFHHSEKEKSRAERLKAAFPNINHHFPLIDAKLDKPDCFRIVLDAGIEAPMMYKLGYPNNNCIGCVKGGMAYWNKIRVDFPEVFDRMAKLERKIGRSCLKKYFLDELPPDAGYKMPVYIADCGATGEVCQTQISRDYHNRE